MHERVRVCTCEQTCMWCSCSYGGLIMCFGQWCCGARRHVQHLCFGQEPQAGSQGYLGSWFQSPDWYSSGSHFSIGKQQDLGKKAEACSTWKGCHWWWSKAVSDGVGKPGREVWVYLQVLVYPIAPDVYPINAHAMPCLLPAI